MTLSLKHLFVRFDIGEVAYIGRCLSLSLLLIFQWSLLFSESLKVNAVIYLKKIYESIRL